MAKNENVAKHRVIHKGWDFNDDLKLFKYDELKVDFGQSWYLNKYQEF